MAKPRIDGKEATLVAVAGQKRRPIQLLAADDAQQQDAQQQQGALVPTGDEEGDRKTPPRVRKPSPGHDQCMAPTGDLELHRRRLREVFGDTLSNEVVDVMLGKLVEALRPGPWDHLEEATLNAALEILDSMKPRSELEALLAIQIIATGVTGMRFLRQSQKHLTADYIDVYGNFAVKLLRLQSEMLVAFERYRRGSKQTVEVRHVHIHSGGQGIVGIVNHAPGEGGAEK